MHLHAIALHDLVGGKMIVHERRTYTAHLVGAYRRADAAATDGDTAFQLTGRDRAGKRRDEIRIVIVQHQRVRAKVANFVPRSAEARDEIFLERETSVVRADPENHCGHRAILRSR